MDKNEIVEIKTIKSFEKCIVLGKELTMYGSLEEPLFLAKDVAKWIEHSNPTAMLENIDEDEKVTSRTKDSLGRDNAATFLTEKGLVQLLSKARTISKAKKLKITKDLQEQGFFKEFSFTSSKETEFISLLEEILEPMGITGERQFYCKEKYIDFYIPSLRLAVEYDENDHNGYTYENQELRQQILENELGCTFIRLSDKNSHAYNVGLVMKEIIRLITSTNFYILNHS